MSDVEVTQADRDAAEAYWESASDDWNPWADISQQERELTVQAFARHRIAAWNTRAADDSAVVLLREALEASTEWLESVLAAMDKYNEANGTYIIGPSLLGSARQAASNRATIDALTGGNHEAK